MKAVLGRFAADRRGATAVEFALVIVPLIALLVGVLEFGRAFWTREALQQAATVSARCMGLAATSCAKAGAYDAATTRTFVQNTLKTWAVSAAGATIQLDRAAACAGVSGFSSVTISLPYQTLIPASYGGGAITLTGSACFPNNS